MTLDENGHLIRIDSLVEFVPYGQASVCQGCGKLMANVWDTICYFCLKPYCYRCVQAIDGKWVCKDHR